MKQYSGPTLPNGMLDTGVK